MGLLDFRRARAWRITTATDGHSCMYFDDQREVPGVRDLTLAEKSGILDSEGSVSALRLDPSKLGEQMDVFEAPMEPSPSFLSSLWEGGPEDG